MATKNDLRIIKKLFNTGHTRKEIREITGIPERTQRALLSGEIKAGKKSIKRLKAVDPIYEQIKYKRKKETVSLFIFQKTEFTTKLQDKNYNEYRIPIQYSIFSVSELSNQAQRIKNILNNNSKRFYFLSVEITIFINDEPKSKIYFSTKTTMDKDDIENQINQLIGMIQERFGFQDLENDSSDLINSFILKKYITIDELEIDDENDEIEYKITAILVKVWEFKSNE